MFQNLGSVMSRLYQEYAKADGANDKSSDESHHSSNSSDKSSGPKSSGGTLRRVKATLTPAVAMKIRKTVFHDLPIEDTLVTQLDLLHYIVGNGILRPSLR